MAVWVQILPGSDKPIYLQIFEQIGEAVAKGQLSTGDKLPAVRKLASELVINPNTVARAYTLLEQAGLVATKMGSGTFVTDPKMRKGAEADVNILAERMDNLIARGINLGIEAEKLKSIFAKRVEQFLRQKKERRSKSGIIFKEKE